MQLTFVAAVHIIVHSFESLDPKTTVKEIDALTDGRYRIITDTFGLVTFSTPALIHYAERNPDLVKYLN